MLFDAFTHEPRNIIRNSVHITHRGKGYGKVLSIQNGRHSSPTLRSTVAERDYRFTPHICLLSSRICLLSSHGTLCFALFDRSTRTMRSAEQRRAAQRRAAQNSAEQRRTAQSSAEQRRAAQSSAEQRRTAQSSAEQRRAAQSSAEQRRATQRNLLNMPHRMTSRGERMHIMSRLCPHQLLPACVCTLHLAII